MKIFIRWTIPITFTILSLGLIVFILLSINYNRKIALTKMQSDLDSFSQLYQVYDQQVESLAEQVALDPQGLQYFEENDPYNYVVYLHRALKLFPQVKLFILKGGGEESSRVWLEASEFRIYKKQHTHQIVQEFLSSEIYKKQFLTLGGKIRCYVRSSHNPQVLYTLITHPIRINQNWKGLVLIAAPVQATTYWLEKWINKVNLGVRDLSVISIWKNNELVFASPQTKQTPTFVRNQRYEFDKEGTVEIQIQYVSDSAGSYVLLMTSVFIVFLIIPILFLFFRMRGERVLFEHRENEMQLKKKQTESLIHSLRAQIKPHFLFNILNSISHMVRLDPPQAQLMIEKLSELFRLILISSQNPISDLKTEIEIVDAYIELQKFRFKERIIFTKQIKSFHLEQIACPSLLLQNIVENAIKHGIEKSTEGGVIELLVSDVDEKGIEVVIENTGSILPENFKKSVGLQSSEEQLKYLLGDRSFFTLATVNGKTQVKFNLLRESL